MHVCTCSRDTDRNSLANAAIAFAHLSGFSTGGNLCTRLPHPASALDMRMMMSANGRTFVDKIAEPHAWAYKLEGGYA